MMRKVLFIAVVVLCMSGLVSADDPLPKWECNFQCLAGLNSEKEYFHEVKAFSVCMEKCLK